MRGFGQAYPSTGTRGFGLGQYVTPLGQLRDPRLSYAKQLRKKASSTAPVGHWMQGLARVFQGYLAGQLQDEAMRGMRGNVDAKGRAITELYTDKVVDMPASATPDMTGKIMPEQYADVSDMWMGTAGQPLTGDVAPTKDYSGARSPTFIGGPVIDPASDRPNWMREGGKESPLGRLNLTPQFPAHTTPEISHQEMGKYGKLLQALNQSQYGGVNPSLIMAGVVQKADRAYKEQREDLKYGRERADTLTDMERKHKYSLALQRLKRKPDPRYETVQNPLGRGGVGQEDQFGKLFNYQKPDKPKTYQDGELRHLKRAGKDITEQYDKETNKWAVYATSPQWNPRVGDRASQKRPGVYNLPDGSQISHNQLMSQYRSANNLMDPLDIRFLERDDPDRAAMEREKARNAMPFNEYAKTYFNIDVHGGYKPKAPKQSASGGLPTPQTQAEFKALPSGAEYIDPDDGRRYRKP
ncbi:MAG: hypothetical protein IH886_02495 [Nitrospinae bacterium]|nr:hypothetical protein [Nitrospinota bacterium]